jgi:hypothetical protein
VFYGEWDGQREKRVIIKIMGERAAPGAKPALAAQRKRD